MGSPMRTYLLRDDAATVTPGVALPRSPRGSLCALTNDRAIVAAEGLAVAVRLNEILIDCRAHQLAQMNDSRRPEK